MAKQYKLIVRRLPRKVCVSIRAAKGRSLVKRRKYVRKTKKGRKGARRRKQAWRPFMKKCMKGHKNYKGKYKLKMCGRRYRSGLRP